MKVVISYKNADLDGVASAVGYSEYLNMIAEKFQRKTLVPSRDIAILLYYGIVSNTINFKSLNTTNRDKNMAKWLKDNCLDIDSNKIKELFEMKSMFPISHLRESMQIEEKFILDNNEWYIGQLEIVLAKEFLNKNINSIRKIMDDVKRDYHTNFVFLNIVDIFDGYHIIYCPFSDAKNLLKKYGYSFQNDIFFEDKLVLRKDIKKNLRDKTKK